MEPTRDLAPSEQALERLADVIPLVTRERELASSPTPSDELQLASSRLSFAALIQPLEIADGGQPLYGKGRDDCQALYCSRPAAVAAAVAEALCSAPDVSKRRLFVVLVCGKRDSKTGRREPPWIDAWERAQRARESSVTVTDSALASGNRCGCEHPECRYQDVCLREAAS